MAKVSGPLFSMEASGGFGGAIVFGKWKGRATVRQLVIPSNPRSAGQEDARNRMRTAGSAQKFVNANTQINQNLTLTDKAEIQAITPSGYAWNGFLVDSIVGAGALNITTSQAIWDGLSAAEQAAWDTAATAMTSLLASVPQTIAGGAQSIPKSNGNVFLNYTYALFVMGLAAIPAAVPPVYT
jgi:hypothetical protein